jgi:putative transposase
VLDEGRPPGRRTTFYRLLRSVHGDVRERCAQATHPARFKPELIATKPNGVWSWDIMKLPGRAACGT